ncbi:IclR family transcriptional regulator [Paraburkholderia tropica]|uniref:IclR family transcriptional regulator n=1 Tax=Paraburkholderia tropica TaxID=92647 RepID=UPI002AAF59B5|nr:helix-turn-helix domain-containing protein [Paraburkholderia tropica]
MIDGVIKTAGRVFEVLEYFREVRRPLSVREIAAHCRYPLSSTAVLLKSMLTLGYLLYDREKKTWFPSVQIAVLGDWVLESMFTNADVLALADELHRRCAETVILAVQNDVFVHYGYVNPSPNPVRFFTPVGTRRTLCMSGLGWAILSEQADHVIRRMIGRSVIRLGRTSRAIDEEYIFSQIEHVRHHGYAFSRGTVTRGAGVIAMPLRVQNLEGRFGIAIAIAAPLERLVPNIADFVALMNELIAGYHREP